MTNLITLLTSPKDSGGWNHVKKLAAGKQWNKVIIITDDKSKANIGTPHPLVVIEIDFRKPIDDIVRDLSGELRKIVTFHEVGLNFVSGNGKEHMALISAIMKVGVGFRLVACTHDGINEI